MLGNLNLVTAGSATIAFVSNGGVQFRLGAVASAVNNLTASGSAGTNSPTLAATGTATNLDVVLTPKGTGTVNVTSGGVTLPGNAASALQAVPLQQLNSTAAGYLPLAGGTLSGPLAINAPTGQLASFNFTRDAGQKAALTTYSGVNARWQIVPGSAETETGSNAGSNFFISRYTDAGVLIDAPMVINRASGAVTLTQSVTTGGPVLVQGTAPTISGGVASGANDALLLARTSGGDGAQIALGGPGYAHSNSVVFLTGTAAARTAGWLDGGGGFLIAGNGYKPGGGAWADSSDARIKTVTGDYTQGLAKWRCWGWLPSDSGSWGTMRWEWATKPPGIAWSRKKAASSSGWWRKRPKRFPCRKWSRGLRGRLTGRWSMTSASSMARRCRSRW